MAYELAKAYVEIVPSAEGLGASIIDELGDAGDEGGKKAGGKAGAAFGKAAAGIAKVGAAALAAGATAAATMVSKAVSSYAEFEQLAGGAELLFGDAYDFIADKATGAWATVQMSQNEYLEQVNGFAVGLKTSLGGDERAAAELADKIITAEADIVAATGNSQEAVQNAFNGIMRGNFTMVDNLQLGLTPTREGYQQMIDSVNAWNAAQGNATNYQMDNLADMESALVDYVAMQGLAGYAANEATETISGSLSALSASWANLLTDLANPDADVAGSVSAVVSSAETVIMNLLPVAESALAGIGSLVENLAPVIAEQLPGLIEAVLPPLLSAAGSLVDGVVSALPSLLQVLMDQVPGILSTFVDTILTNLPLLVAAALQVITSLATGIGEALPTLIPAIVDCVLTIVETLTQPENIQMVIGAALTLILGLVDGIIQAIPQIINALPMIIDNIIQGLVGAIPQIAAAGVQLITSIVSNLPQIIAGVIRAIPQIIASLVRGIVQAVPQMAQAGLQLIRGLFQGISNAVGWLYGQLRGWVNNVLSYIKGLFGIHSPSTEMAWVGEMLAAGVAEGIEDGAPLAVDAMQDMADELRGVDLTAGVQDAVADVTLRTRALTGAVSASGASAGVSPAGDLAGAVMALSAKLDRMAVYIYGDKLVGYLATDIDQALGSRAILAGRGSLA